MKKISTTLKKYQNGSNKFSKYTKYKKLPQTISKPLERPPQPLEVISLRMTVSIDHMFNLY